MPVFIRGVLAIILLSVTVAGLSAITPPLGHKQKDRGAIFSISGTDDSGADAGTGSVSQQSETDIGKEEQKTENLSLFELLQRRDTSSTKATVEINATTSDIVTVLKKYGNEVGETIQKYAEDTQNQERTFEKFVREPTDQVARDSFLILRDAYLKISEDLYEINPPQSAKDAHERFAHAYFLVGKSMETLSASEPSVENLTLYSKDVVFFIEAYTNMAQLLRTYGVNFTKLEPGSIFTLPF